MSFNPQLSPSRPGVYLFKDTKENVIYIGKAKNLKTRLMSYFRKSSALDSRKLKMVSRIKNFSYIVTNNEIEALILEANLIKQYRPRFNIVFRDDKNYPYIKITTNEKWPRIKIVRKTLQDGNIYFGPYVSSKILRETITFIKKTFQIRTCRHNLNVHTQSCLQHQIGRCLSPCSGKVNNQDYLKIVEYVRLFLLGKRMFLLEKLEARMRMLSDETRFEEAAKIRDQLSILHKCFETQTVISQKLLDTENLKQKLSADTILQSLKKVLNLHIKPLSIGVFDVSTTQGSESVGVFIWWENGEFKKNLYRHIKIKNTQQTDDYRMMKETIKRILSNLNPNLPKLLIIDGGKEHLNIAKTALLEMKLNIQVISVAKKPDRAFLSNNTIINLKDNDEISLLLRKLRDEAHRFAVYFHRKLRDKRLQKSILEDIKGIGQKKRFELLRRFGSIDNIRAASIENILKVKGITRKIAESLLKKINEKE